MYPTIDQLAADLAAGRHHRGDDQQQAEGQLQESKGDLKQAGEKIKDALS